MKSNPLKDRINNIKTPYNPDAWQQMQQRLDKQGGTTQTTIPSRIKTILGISLMLGIGLLFFVGFNFFETSNEIEKENASISISEEDLENGSSYSETKQKDKTAISDKESLIGETIKEPTIVEDIASAASNLPTKNTINSISESSIESNSNKTYIEKEAFKTPSNLSKTALKTNTNQVTSSSKNEMENSLANKAENIGTNNSENSELVESEDFSAQQFSKEETVNGKTAKNELLTEIQAIELLPLFLLSDSFLIEEPSSSLPDIVVKRKNTKSSRWSIFANAGAAQYGSFLYNGYRLDAGAAYQFSSRFSLEGAVTYFNAKPKAQPTNGTDFAKQTDISVYANFDVLEWGRHSLGIQAGGGLSFSDAVKNFENVTPTFVFSKSGTGLHYRLGGRYEFAINRKTSLTCNAYITHYIEDIRGISFGIIRQI